MNTAHDVTATATTPAGTGTDQPTAPAAGSRTPLVRRLRVLAVTLAVIAAALGAVVGTKNDRADAWAWSSTVTLNGRIGCNYATSNVVSWAWVQASNGEAGWASLGSGGMTRKYSYTFTKAPSNMSVTVRWGCSTDGAHTTTFGVARPAVGTTTTRNLCYWSPCWI